MICEATGRRLEVPFDEGENISIFSHRLDSFLPSSNIAGQMPFPAHVYFHLERLAAQNYQKLASSPHAGSKILVSNCWKYFCVEI
jgi:hypothetical protein